MAEIKIAGSDETVKIGKVICLLRSYEAHAEEMGSTVPDNPEFFLKPSTAIIGNRENIKLPEESEDVHHEVELAVVIGKGGKNIPKGGAMEHVFGYAVFIDVTARDIQSRAKKAGKPWSAAKGYDTFAPMSDITPKDKVPDPHDLGIWLKVNGETRQMSNTGKMIFTIEEIIEHISRIMALERGDVIATGTPEGVSRIVAGDEIEAGIEGVGIIEVGVG
jgi:2-keto-4-pentenoate hydratase/2-oxohepta-3-ene-1,7-dioic acid hydratase in catechol pathway